MDKEKVCLFVEEVRVEGVMMALLSSLQWGCLAGEWMERFGKGSCLRPSLHEQFLLDQATLPT